MHIRLNTFGRIHRGPLRDTWCQLARDEQADGFFVVVYRDPDATSAVLLSDWLPTLEALNGFIREQDWALTWIET